MKYENYIFDLYGTLVDISTNEEKDSLWEDIAQFYTDHNAPYTPRELRKNYEAAVNAAISLTEEIQIDSVFRQLFLAKGVMPEPELFPKLCRMFREKSTDYIRLYPGTEELLQKIKDAGKNIYLLSNAQRSFTANEIQKLGLEKYFDGIFISSDYGVKKPNPQFFRILTDSCSLHPVECLMIGNDEICDIAGGQSAGMDTFYIHSNISPEYTGQAEATYMQMEEVKNMAELPLP